MDFNNTQQKKKSFLRRLMAGNLQPQESDSIQPNEDQASPLDTEADNFSRQSLLRNQLANYNQKVPEVPKEKLGKKLLQYGGAGLLGAATGVGALPAIAMTGLFKHISKNKKQAANMEATSKHIEDLSAADIKDREFENDQARLDQQAKYQQGELGLGKERNAIAWDQNNIDRMKAAAQKSGYRLPATQAASLAEGKNLPKILSNLQKTFDDNKGVGGPIMGNLVYNPYATKTQKIQAEIDATKQFVGKFLEGGVLRKEDEEKYKKILPTINDTEAVRTKKISAVKDLISQKYNEYLNSFDDAGYDVSQYEPLTFDDVSGLSNNQNEGPQSGATQIGQGDDGNMYLLDEDGNILGRAK